MDQNDESLAPWAHPKAKEWLELIFQKSNLVEELSNWILSGREPLTIGQQRMVSMILIVLGHNGIWPELQRETFAQFAAKLQELSREARQSAKPHSKADEQIAATQINADWEREIEMLRRRAGISKRINLLDLPPTWKRFWN